MCSPVMLRKTKFAGGAVAGLDALKPYHPHEQGHLCDACMYVMCSAASTGSVLFWNSIFTSSCNPLQEEGHYQMIYNQVVTD